MEIPYFEIFLMYFRQLTLGKEHSDNMTYCDSTI